MENTGLSPSEANVYYYSLSESSPDGFQKFSSFETDIETINLCLFADTIQDGLKAIEELPEKTAVILITPSNKLSYTYLKDHRWQVALPKALYPNAIDIINTFSKIQHTLIAKTNDYQKKINHLKNQNTLLDVTAKTGDALQTALKKQTDIAEEMRQKANFANKSKSVFLANMSHEIRTPMNGVIGMLDLLMDSKLKPEQKSYAAASMDSANSLLTIINDILDFSKIEAGKLDIENNKFDLDVILDSFTDIVSVKSFEKGIEFAVLIKKDVPTKLIGDPGRLRQILTNLSNNAIKFVEKGEVVIKVSVKQDKKNEVKLLFEVCDTGIGIPKEKLNKLFRPFVQADVSTNRLYGGTGLGLSISKQLAKLLGGEIGADSELNKGTRFWFTATFRKQKHSKEKVDIASDIKNQKILIIEDNATNRKVFKEYLELWKCRFGFASTSNEALSKLKEAVSINDPFTIAIIDSSISQVSSQDPGRIIKQNKKLSNTILILLSSLPFRGDAEKIKEIGFASLLTKPIKKTKLYDCIRTISSLPLSKLNDPLMDLIITYKDEEIKKSPIKTISKKRILLAEDNRVNQKVVVAMLKKKGHEVVIANNGKEAASLYKGQEFDFVFMDIQMPVMDGLSAIKNIRKYEKNNKKRTPVVALTANALKGDKERYLEAGMDDYLTKPIKAIELMEMLKKWV
ncbi:MAG: response regulator [Desulfobacteraceae bacterium]|nr:response regulator [Desulfobacteraceae bacterium]